MTLTVEIPALDRLCGVLEGWQRAGVCQEIENEIVAKLKEAAGGGALKEAAGGGALKEAAQPSTPATEEADEAREAPAEAPAKAQRGGKGKKPTEKPAPPEEPAEGPQDAPGDVKDTDVRKALNGLIKAGKRDEVKAILKAFGAENFSKLTPNQYPEVLKKAKEVMGDA